MQFINEASNCSSLHFFTEKGSRGGRGERGPKGGRGRTGRPGPAIFFDSGEEVLTIKGEKVNSALFNLELLLLN